MKLGDTVSKMRLGNTLSGKSERNIAINVEGDVVEGRLAMSFGYNKYEYEKATIEKLAAFYKLYLLDIINHLKAKEAVSGSEYYPCSSAQKRLYALGQIEKDSINYNIPFVILLEGNFDVERAKQAIEVLISRHEVLRTSFSVVEGEIVQRVNDEVEFDIFYAEAGEDEAEALVEKFIKPFDLGAAPLMRTAIIRLSENKHILMLDIHHIISDAASNKILIKEFNSIYRGDELAPLRMQYKDFAVWQNKLFESESIKKQEAYWVESFTGKLPRLNLQTDYERPAMQSFEGRRYLFNAGREMTEELNMLATGTGTTIFMVLMSAYKVLLANYAYQEDLVVGTPIVGRTHAELENTVGMFVNTLPIRSYPKANKTFAEFLGEVRGILLKAYECQDYQLDMLLDKLNIRREPDRNPLFDVAFVYEDIKQEEVNVDGIKVTPYSYEYTVSKFDMTLYANKDAEDIYFELEYCTSLFKEDTIERFAVDFLEVLRKITSDRNVRINEIVSGEFEVETVDIDEIEFKF